MKTLPIYRSAVMFSVVVLAVTACGSDNATRTASDAGAGRSSAPAASKVSGTLTGIGASSQKAATEAWKVGFEARFPGAKVQYSPDGSGAGRKAFLSGAAQFAGSDAYLKDEEMEAAREVCGPDGARNIPAYTSPIAVAFNLAGVEELNLDAETIAGIFTGKIRKWNDRAIAGQNKGTELPDTAITVVHRSDESGTTENFVDYLASAAPSVWTYGVSGAWPADSQAENAKGTSAVVSTATVTNGAITYADASAVGDLGQVKIKVGGEYVALAPEAAAKAVDVATPVPGRPDLDMSRELERDTVQPGAYPLVLISYHLYCSAYEDQNTVDLIKAFGSYVSSEEGQMEAAESAGNAPLSNALRTKAQEAIDSIEVAS